jgi:epoxyqueuosine reductase
VRGNRNVGLASWEWAQVYIETNGLIDRICARLQLVLAGQGVKLAFFPPTYVFDTELLVAAWSHKHIAYRCGLGQFGRNQLLVTSKGCAGRLGSAVVDVKLEYDTPLTPRSYCQASGCHYCDTICPVQAIMGETFNRQACYRQCQWNDVHYSDLESCEVCGKCATGPCAYLENTGLISTE